MSNLSADDLTDIDPLHDAWVANKAYQIFAQNCCALIDAAEAGDRLRTLQIANDVLNSIETSLVDALKKGRRDG